MSARGRLCVKARKIFLLTHKRRARPPGALFAFFALLSIENPNVQRLCRHGHGTQQYKFTAKTNPAKQLRGHLTPPPSRSAPCLHYRQVSRQAAATAWQRKTALRKMWIYPYAPAYCHVRPTLVHLQERHCLVIIYTKSRICPFEYIREKPYLPNGQKRKKAGPLPGSPRPCKKSAFQCPTTEVFPKLQTRSLRTRAE